MIYVISYEDPAAVIELKLKSFKIFGNNLIYYHNWTIQSVYRGVGWSNKLALKCQTMRIFPRKKSIVPISAKKQ